MKLLLLFPGIGYRFDKPLLSKSKELALHKDYHVIEVPYTSFLDNLKGDTDKISKSVLMCLEETKTLLKDVDFNAYDKVVCISKSIGTIISNAYMNELNIEYLNIYLTPLKETFLYDMNGIVFHGTNDPWMDTKVCIELCNKNNIKYYLYENANHSLVVNDSNISNYYLNDVLNKIDYLL